MSKQRQQDKWRLSQKIKGYRAYQQLGPVMGFLVDLLECDINVEFVYFQKKDSGFLYFDSKKYYEAGQKVFNNFLDDQKFIQTSLAKIFQYSDQLRKVGQLMKKMNFSSMSDNELEKIYSKFIETHNKLWRIAMRPNLLEFENSFLTDYLINYLKQNGVPEKILARTFSFLLEDRRKSEQQRRDKKLTRLLFDLQKEYIKNKNFSLQSDARVKRFYNKYAYLTYNWSGPAISLAEFINEIQLLLKQPLKKTASFDNRKYKLTEQINLDSYHLKLFKILSDIIFSKAYRMEASYFAYYNAEKLFFEIGKRLNLTVFQTQSIPPPEMKRFLVQKHFVQKEITNYTNLILYYRRGKSIAYISGQQAEKKLRNILPQEQKVAQVNMLRGQTAFPGKVSGVVKIISTKDEMNKFLNNNILVSPYTDPTLMPVIKKAKAIITDVGGMTCHAAIVSRELKKPCIIGTKFATQVLKDNDKVEVDANRGVVKIL